MRQYFLAILAVVAVAFVGCKNNPFNEQNGSSAYISFDINSVAIDVETTTKAAALPSVNDFTITITPKGAATPLYTFLYENRPAQPLKLEAGEYVFDCFYGDIALQATDKPAYNETQTLSLAGAIEAQTVTFNPKRTHYCFEVVYPVGFDQHYSNYRVSVSSAALGTPFEFGGSEQPAIHYFKIGSEYTATLLATKKSDNSAVNVVLADVAEGEAKTYHQLNLLFPAPRFTSVAAHVITETVAYETSTDITFVSASTISSVQMTVNFANADLASLNGSYTLDASTIASLAAQGIVCQVNANDGKVSIAQSIKDKFLSFGNVNTDYTIKIDLEDINGRSATSTTIYTVEPPVFKIPDMQGAFWTKTFDGSVLTEAEVTTGDAVTVLAGMSYMISDGTNWIPLTPNNGKLYLDNLTPNIDYTIAATYRDITVTSVFKTEEPTQVPNSNFETWVDTRETHSGQPFFRLREADGTEWWDTRNIVTCPSDSKNQSQCSSSSTRKTSGYKGNGAIIHTAGWGSWNTYVGLGAAIIGNITPGTLFVGKHDGSEKHGKEFNSRPTSMTFYYKYDPYGTGDQCTAKIWVENRTASTTTILGEGIFKTGNNVNNFSKQSVNLSYTNTTLAPTHICIAFYCGDLGGNKKYIKAWSYDDNGYWYGARMWVDEVELIYDK